MNGLLDRFTTILHRRFMLVSFLPVLIFTGGLGLLILVATENGGQALAWWSRLPGSLQIIVFLSTFAAVWLLAGFVDSHSRNLIQLFEGYPFERLAPRLYERATTWHSIRRAILDFDEEDLEDTDLAEFLPKHRKQRPDRFSEESFILYPEDDLNTMPTRVGNVLRAAEDHAEKRYGVDYLIVWPRLTHMCSERFIDEYEDARAKLEFLLVVSTLAGLFAFAGGGLLLVFRASVAAFVIVVLVGSGLAWFAYHSAVHAAIEYGEKIRASMDLYRLDLLRQLRYGEPRGLEEEQRYWREFAGLFQGVDRGTPYVPLLPAPDEEQRG